MKKTKTAVNCMHHYKAPLVAFHAKEEGAVSSLARPSVQSMVCGDYCKLNTAEEVEERADKWKDLDCTFTACRHLPT